MRGRPLALGLTSALALAVGAREAEACSTAGPGVDFVYAEAAHQPIPWDGVVPVAVIVRSRELVEEVTRMSASFEDDGGVVTPAEIVAIDLSPPPEPGVPHARPGLLVVRPLAALTPASAYRLRIEYAEDDLFEPEAHEVLFTTSAEAFAAPPVTTSASLAARHAVVEARMCCETAMSSCGDSYWCSATRVRLTPSARIEAAIATAAQSQGLPWVARVDGEGALVDRRYPDLQALVQLPALAEGEFDAWSAAAADYPLAAGSGVRCFVAGVTDLRSLAEARSEPFCVDTDVEALPDEELQESAPSAGPGPFQECIGPWIDERLGEGEAATGGCAIGGAAGPRGALVVVVVVALARPRRRRRCVSRGRAA